MTLMLDPSTKTYSMVVAEFASRNRNLSFRIDDILEMGKVHDRRYHVFYHSQINATGKWKITQQNYVINHKDIPRCPANCLLIGQI